MPSFARTPAILSLSLFFLSSTSPFILPSPTVSSLEKYVVLNFYHSPIHQLHPHTHLSLPNTYFENSSPLLSGSSGPRLKFGLNFKQWTTPLITNQQRMINMSIWISSATLTIANSHHRDRRTNCDIMEAQTAAYHSLMQDDQRCLF